MRIAYKEKLEVFIKVINQSGLGKIVKMYGQDAGLHFLLEVNNGMREPELIAKARAKNVRVYGLSEYYHNPNEKNQRNILVIGYSSINKENIEKVVKLLAKAWM